MDSVKRFFRKYLLSTIGILVLFFGLNIIMVVGILVSANRNSTDPAIHIRQIGDSITLSKSGEIISTETVLNLLETKNAWAMMLNQGGDVIWQERMPEEIPRQYTVTDVAKFSRWYLKDYPVYVLEHPAGLLVVGCEPNSLQKYNLSLDASYISTIVMGVGIAIIANALLMVFLILRNTRRIEKSVAPILTGIETISQGKSVSLMEKGELAQINVKLNRAGRYIAQKDQARAEWISGISHDVTITVDVTQMMDFCIITVTDDGIGIDNEQQESLNNDIFSTQPTPKSGDATHGFGLKLSSQIVHAHNGRIHFANIRPHGLQVTISLPIE